MVIFFKVEMYICFFYWWDLCEKLIIDRWFKCEECNMVGKYL